MYEKIIESAKSSVISEIKYAKKIYLSRSKFKKAKKNEAGLEWLDSWMVKNGFKIIYPEKMDIISLILMLQQAEEVCAVSGTLPHYTVFSKEKTRLIILEKYPTINNYQQGIDLLFNLDTTLIDCGAFIRPVSPGLGPFIIYPTPQLINYAEENNLVPPPVLTQKEIQKYLKLFLNRFKRNYYQQWIMPHWLTEEIEICCNAYNETEKLFGPWLSGTRILYFYEFFNPIRILKKVKKLF